MEGALSFDPGARGVNTCGTALSQRPRGRRRTSVRNKPLFNQTDDATDWHNSNAPEFQVSMIASGSRDADERWAKLVTFLLEAEPKQ
jgi:hypothetical protein